MKLAPADERKLLLLLDELARGVEDLFLTGLTTASEATRQTLQVAFQEASRLRLLRLGSTLRVASDELGRFTRNDAEFSRKRLLFFLNRAWLLSQGLAKSLRAGNEQAFDRLLWSPASQAVPKLELVCLGVGKRITSSVVAFEFRLRVVQATTSVPVGQRLAWSCIFPIKPGNEIPAEAFLQLDQKQKFKPSIFLDGHAITLEKIAVILDEHGGGRLMLDDGSSVKLGGKFDGWHSFLSWDPVQALERLAKHESGPFDLDIELQEEIVLNDWDLGEPVPAAEGNHIVYPITHRSVTFDAVSAKGVEGQTVRKAFDALAKQKSRPPLFGLMHFEKCRLMLQPLTTFDKDVPEYLTISKDNVDKKTLLKALKF